ncbi:MAG: helix-turn-helix transcriptional regulator [Turicibacter sp.]|nr:helix-turn-helix transcriptional regulator [Turicibacter sp.]
MEAKPKTLGRRLRRLRKINGETQKEFAENFGRHYRTIQNWELDRSVPDVFTAMVLAEYYNMSVEELVNGEDYYDKEF